jgi:amino-acid N-acetyltransferase
MDVIPNPDLAAVIKLLSASRLPTADLTAEHLQHFFGYASGGETVGVVGVEPCGDVALLRSLAVSESQRGLGLGNRLVECAERYARDRGVRSIYLLTTTAEAFFLRRGYSRLSREKAPPPIQSTQEFSGICPSTSVFMVKDLAAASDSRRSQ